MKKILLAGGALAAVLVAMPMFAAFEAHVVNVTATINNALTVDTTPIAFGNVFPEEVLHHPLDIALSSSFTNQSNTQSSNVSYFIRQKAKCGVPDPAHPGQYLAYAQAGENDNGTPENTADDTWTCPLVTVAVGDAAPAPVQSVVLPSLCPFLSKHSDVTPDASPDGNIEAFHGTLPWTVADSLSTTVLGSLTKTTDPDDLWDIDLHAPCFAGQCAQDNVVPPAYQLDPTLQNQQLGCDLWVEVSAIPQI